MDPEPQQPPQDPPPPPPGPDGEPKMLGNMKGWIAGATGLVVALGGLATAYKQMWGDSPAEPQAAVAGEAPKAEPSPAEDSAAADAAAEPEAGAPTLYEGDGAKLEWEGEEWVLTDEDTRYHYDETYSPDEHRYLAFDKENDLYLRWPIKGGMAEEGSADKQTWTNYKELYPVEP